MPFKHHVGHRVRVAPFVAVIALLRLVAGNDVGLAVEQSPFYQGKVNGFIVEPMRTRQSDDIWGS
jgi:hypothetical protein